MSSVSPPPHPNSSIADQIETLCTAFESEWQQGESPPLEPWLAAMPEAAQPQLLYELLRIEIEWTRRQGSLPQPEDYLQRFPRWRPSVEAAFLDSLQPADELQVGQQLGNRFRLVRELGQGAFARVFLALDEQLQRHVALKIPLAHRFSSWRASERWLHEARQVAKLDHPHIVAVYDVLDDARDHSLLLVMQYVPGNTLQYRIERESVDWETAVALVEAIADALQHAHRRGLLHRDLKPHNILLDEQGHPWLTDFGLSMSLSDRDACRGQWAGTVSYMPPEQLHEHKEPPGPAGDLWAAGVILYQLLTGQLPFSADQRQPLLEEIESQELIRPRQLASQIPRAVEQVCMRALAIDPRERYTSADQLRSALAGCRRRPWRRLALRSAVLATAVLLALLPWSFGGSPSGLSDQQLDGNLELLVWNESQPGRAGVRWNQTGTLPLRPGDRLRLEASLNRPAYLYLVWIDHRGQAWPVYPGPAGRWQATTTDSPMPHRWLALPQQEDAGWPMQEDCTGMQTVYLLARYQPLPDDLRLSELFADLREQPLEHRQAWFRFCNGRRVDRRDPYRSPDFGAPTPIPAPVLKNQQHLQQQLQPWFDLILSISFACEGWETEAIGQ